MYHVPKKTKNPLLAYGLINCVLLLLIGAPFLQTILSSPSYYNSANQHFSSTASQGFINIINFLIYSCYLITPVIILNLLLLAFNYKKALLVFCYSCLTLWLIIDTKVFSLFHFHLSDTHLSLLLHNEAIEVLSLSFTEVIYLIFLVVGIIFFQLFLLKLSIKISNKVNLQKYTRWYLTLWFVCGFCCLQLLFITARQQNNIFIQHLANLPMALQIFKQVAPVEITEFLTKHSGNFYPSYSVKKFNYPKQTMQCKKKNQPYNILLIAIDTLRFDTVNTTHMPNIFNFAESNRIQFNHHFSGGNATQPGLFSLFYALPSNYWYAALEQNKPPVLMKVLQEQGYAQKVIWSTNMRHPQVSKTIYSTIKNLRLDSAPGNDALDWDKDTTQQAINYLQQHKDNQQPFFLHIFYHSLHAFCRTNKYKAYFLPTTNSCQRLTLNNHTDPLPLKNRYLNVAKTLDSDIANLLDEIQRLNLLKNTIVIITSDHGQEFNDNQQNYWGHTSNYSRFQLQVPLYIYWPDKKGSVIKNKTTHYDIAPTLLKHALGCTNNFTDYSIGQDLFNPKIMTNTSMIAGSYVDMAIVQDSISYVFKNSGEIEYFNSLQQQENKSPPPKLINNFIKLTQKFYR